MRSLQVRVSRFTLSKVVYVVMIIVALPLDIVVARKLDALIDEWLPEWLGLPLAGLVALVVGVGSYLLYLWQIEQLTKRGDE